MVGTTLYLALSLSICLLFVRQHFLPNFDAKDNESEGETFTRFWCVKDMYDFENIGFTHSVNGLVKYLTCADCEIGPLGFHPVTDAQRGFFVSSDRVCATEKND